MSLMLVCLVGMLMWKEPMAQHDDHHAEEQGNEMHSDVPFHPVTMADLERFHGHVGPFVALGARMGEYAITQYNLPRYFGITVDAECPAIPPHACLIDGLMVSTGATYGKKNIHHIEANQIKVTIRDDRTGAYVVFTLKPSTLSLLKKWEEENIPVPERGQQCFDQKAEDLFDFEYFPATEK